MHYNAKADIHAGKWYSTAKGIKYECTRADWQCDTINHLYMPINIHLRVFKGEEEKYIATDKMIKLLETGALVVIKSPM